MKKTIGIIGGMGPLATSDLFLKIIENEEAGADQEHVHVLIDNNTNIPDRTEAILHGGEDPVPEIAKSALRLQGAGAEVLIMSCITAHCFYDRILQFVEVPFLNMLEETAKHVDELGIETVGLLATDGTVQSGIYDEAFERYGIAVEKPSAENQAAVMRVVYDVVKAGATEGADTAGFLTAVSEMQRAGAQTMILGCTELPVAYELFEFDFPAIDPTLVLARSAIKFAGGRLVSAAAS